MSTALIGIRAGRPAAIRFGARLALYEQEFAWRNLVYSVRISNARDQVLNCQNYSTVKRGVRRDLRLDTETTTYDGFTPERLVKMLSSTHSDIKPLVDQIVRKNDVPALFTLIDSFKRKHTQYLIICLEALIVLLKNRSRKPLVTMTANLLLKRDSFIEHASPERRSKVVARFRTIVIRIMEQHFQFFAEDLRELLQLDYEVADGLSHHVLEVMSTQHKFNDQMVTNLCELLRFRKVYELYKPSDLVLVVEAAIAAKRFSAAVTVYNDFRDRHCREHIILGAVLGAQSHLGPLFSRIFLECLGNVRAGEPMDDKFMDMIYEMGATLYKLNPSNLQLFIEEAFFIKTSAYFTDTGLVMLSAIAAASGLAGAADRIAAQADLMKLRPKQQEIIRRYRIEANSRAGKLSIVENIVNEGLLRQEPLLERDVLDVLRACRLKGSVSTAIKWWTKWKDLNPMPSTAVYNAYISALIRTNGARAWTIFEKMPDAAINVDTLEILLASAVRYNQQDRMELLTKKREALGLEQSPTWIYHMMCYYQRNRQGANLEDVFKKIQYTWKLEARHFYPLIQHCISQKRSSQAERLLDLYLDMGFYAEHRYYSLAMEVIGLRADYDPQKAFDSALASLDSLETYRKFRKSDDEIEPFSTTMYNRVLSSQMKHRRFADCHILIKRMLDTSADLNTYFRKIELESCTGDHRAALGTWSLVYNRLREGDTSKNYFIMRQNRFNYGDMLVAVINSLCANSRSDALLLMPQKLAEINLGFTPDAWRFYFQGLLAAAKNKDFSGSVYLQLLAIAETSMIDYNFNSKRKQPDRQYHAHTRRAMSEKTFNMLADNMEDVIEYVAKTKQVSLGKAEKMLRKEFPKTVPAALWLHRKQLAAAKRAESMGDLTVAEGTVTNADANGDVEEPESGALYTELIEKAETELRNEKAETGQPPDKEPREPETNNGVS